MNGDSLPLLGGPGVVILEDAPMRSVNEPVESLLDRTPEEPEGPRAPAGKPDDAWVERELSERELLLSSAERIAHMGSWVWDVRSGRVGWSDELFRILGLDPARDEPTIENFFASIHEDDIELVKKYSRLAVEQGVNSIVECRVRRRDGSIRDVTLNGSRIMDAKGELARIVGTALDTTELRATERELRRTAAMLNEAQRIARVGSWVWDSATGGVEWSEQLYRILGIHPSIPPTKELFFRCVHPDDRERLRELWAPKGAPAELPGATEFRLLRPDGEVRQVFMEAKAIGVEPASPTTVAGIVLDLTERKLLERQLLQAQKMEALGRLAGGIAHDFNNLLTVIFGYLNLLGAEMDRSELSEIALAAEKAAALTRQLLAFSRHSVVERVVVDLSEVVRSAAELTTRLIGEDVELRFSPSPEPWRVKADPGQIHQALINLVINARDAMPNGGRLGISIDNLTLTEEQRFQQSKAAPGEYVVLSVSDTGVGMDAATLHQAFEPFFTTKEPGRGTGLGLSTVFGLMTQNEGAIDVVTEPGRGTTFRLLFPRTLEPAKAPAPAIAPPRGGSESLLVVEDDEGVRRLIASVLTSAGYQVTAAATPGEALELARGRAEPFDLVCADVVMPGMSGRALGRTLKDEGRTRALLYVTGYAPPGGRDEEPPEPDRYLLKPIAPNALLAAVREVLDHGARAG